MKRLYLDEAFDAWDKLWDKTTKEFFKVEDLQNYVDEQEEKHSSIRLWLSGDKEGSIKEMLTHKEEWAIETQERPIRKIRIHIVEYPLSKYLEWEIMHYKLINIPYGGEEVYLVDRKDVPNYNLGDYMMFDEMNAVKSNYASGNYLESFDIYENEPIQQFKDAKKLLMQFAKKIEVD